MLRQQIRFCTSHDGARIAYATSGSGPPLVKVANWLSHLEFDVTSPVWSSLLSEMSRAHTLIRYDERGCGLSDWNVDDLSFDAWVRDLETVVAASGADRFPLLGISQGASIAIAYAVRHPERVTHLVLHGGYARGRLIRSNTAEQREEAETMAKLRSWLSRCAPVPQSMTRSVPDDERSSTHDVFPAVVDGGRAGRGDGAARSPEADFHQSASRRAGQRSMSCPTRSIADS